MRKVHLTLTVVWLAILLTIQLTILITWIVWTCLSNLRRLMRYHSLRYKRRHR